MLDNDKKASAQKIGVRDYLPEDEWENPEIPEWTDDVYCIDTEGLLQYKNAEAKVGQKTYLTLADAVAGAATVILAMGAGRKAAAAIHEYILGNK